MGGFLVQDQPLYQFCVLNSATVKEGSRRRGGRGERGRKGGRGREGKGGERGRELERERGNINVSREWEKGELLLDCF